MVQKLGIIMKLNNIDTSKLYTCSNSGLRVELLNVVSHDENGFTAHIRYFTTFGTYIGIETNVRLEFDNIKHWREV